MYVLSPNLGKCISVKMDFRNFGHNNVCFSCRYFFLEDDKIV